MWNTKQWTTNEDNRLTRRTMLWEPTDRRGRHRPIYIWMNDVMQVMTGMSASDCCR